MNPSRGGVIFNTSQDLDLLRVTSTDSGDDAIAFYVTGIDSSNPRTNRPIRRIIMNSCVSYSRENAEYGAALKFAGAWEAHVANCTFRNSKNSLVYFRTFPGGFNPRDITVKGCRMLSGQKDSFQIVADKAMGISARGNYMDRPSRDCVRIQSLTGAARVFDVTIADNILVKRRSRNHIDVQPNLSGVRTSANTRLRSPDTTTPTIGNLSPAPYAKTRDTTPTIKATVKDNVTDLSKRNIELYVSGKAIPASGFRYDQGRNLLSYTSSRLPPGKHTAKVVATDKAGNRATRTWTFRVVRG